VRICDDSGDVQKHDKKKNHGAQESCGEPGIFLEDNTEGGSDVSDANEIDPKKMRWNPGGDAGGHKGGDREVFSGKGGQGDGVKEAAEGHELVNAVGLRDVVLEDEREADGEQGQAEEVGPKDGPRDRESRESERRCWHLDECDTKSGLAPYPLEATPI